MSTTGFKSCQQACQPTCCRPSASSTSSWSATATSSMAPFSGLWHGAMLLLAILVIGRSIDAVPCQSPLHSWAWCPHVLLAASSTGARRSGKLCRPIGGLCALQCRPGSMAAALAQRKTASSCLAHPTESGALRSPTTAAAARAAWPCWPTAPATPADLA